MNRQQRIIELRNKGLSYQKIGYMLGLSRQRIHQLLSGYCSPAHNHTYNNIRTVVLERDNHRCQLCDSQENLITHHIDGNDLNDSLNNLITLCTTCHSTFHGSIRGGRICIQCGVRVIKTDHRIAYSRSLCRNCYTNQKQTTWPEFKCIRCGNTFAVRRSQVNRMLKEELPLPHFCGKDCYFKTRGKAKTWNNYRELVKNLMQDTPQTH